MRVIFFDLDTLRPDHLGCYGYNRNTSPNIDSVAQESVRFENYFCSDAPCLPSRSALMSGLFGIHNGAIGHGGTAADQKLEGKDRGFRSQYAAHCLPNLFRKAGYTTASISPFAERHSSFWFYAGFNEMYNTGGGGMESAEQVSPVVLDWLERNGNRDNWFLHINFWDPHTPYRAPEDFGNPFEKEPLETFMTQELIDKHREDIGPHGAREIAMFDNSTNPKFPRHPGEVRDMDEYKRLVDGYDCGIAYMDSHIGKIIVRMKEMGIWEDTAVIISSDHGENMGELNSYAEHATADYVTCRIPMIIRWKGCKSGHADKGLHYNLDLVPTLSDLLNVPKRKDWDGISYIETLKNGTEQKRDYIVLSQCAHVCQRSVLFDGYLYMRTYHDGYHSYAKEMLFDIQNDPHELYDLAKDKPELCAKGARYLMEWHDEMMKTIEDGIDPMETVLREGGPFHPRGQLKRYYEYLMQTGRKEQAEKLLRRHGKAEGLV